MNINNNILKAMDEANIKDNADARTWLAILRMALIEHNLSGFKSAYDRNRDAGLPNFDIAVEALFATQLTDNYDDFMKAVTTMKKYTCTIKSSFAQSVTQIDDLFKDGHELMAYVIEHLPLKEREYTPKLMVTLHPTLTQSQAFVIEVIDDDIFCPDLITVHIGLTL